MIMKKLMSIVAYLAFIIFSLIYFVFIAATISIGYYLFTVFMIVTYGFILLAIIAIRTQNKHKKTFNTRALPTETQNSLVSIKTIKSAAYTNDDDDYEEDDLDENLEYEDNEDEDNDMFDSGYGNWKFLSFGFGQFIKLTGTTFGNRQTNISKLKRGSKLIPKYFLYDNKPAIELFLSDLSIGFIPKELSSEFTLLKEHLKDIVVREVIGGTSGKNLGVVVDYRLAISAEDKLKEIYKER